MLEAPMRVTSAGSWAMCSWIFQASSLFAVQLLKPPQDAGSLQVYWFLAEKFWASKINGAAKMWLFPSMAPKVGDSCSSSPFMLYQHWTYSSDQWVMCLPWVNFCLLAAELFRQDAPAFIWWLLTPCSELGHKIAEHNYRGLVCPVSMPQWLNYWTTIHMPDHLSRDALNFIMSAENFKFNW